MKSSRARVRVYLLGLFAVLLFQPLGLCAQPKQYFCELGVRGGTGYYVGDAAPHIFNHPLWAVGGEGRYKIDQRWSIRGQGMLHDVYIPRNKGGYGKFHVNLDVAAEFNFFRVGTKQYDRRVKTYSPYIFLGVGCGIFKYQESPTAAAYIPFGIGFRWKFSQRVGLNLAWQHNFYFSDKLEGIPSLNNTHDLNGKNIFNNDLTSQLTLGIVFEFVPKKKICRVCYTN